MRAKAKIARLTALLASVLIAGLAACGDGGDGGGGVGVEPRVPSTVTVQGPDSLMVGEEERYSARVLDQDGRVMTGADVSWVIGDIEVAKLTATGVATAVAEGTTEIRARAKNEHGEAVGSLALTVVPAPTFALARDTIRLAALGATDTITGTVNGEPAEITLTELSAARWNQGLPVVSKASTVPTATGAGTVRYVATPDSLDVPEGVSVSSDTVTVIVTPATPYIFTLSADGPVSESTALVLAGWRLGDLSANAFAANTAGIGTTAPTSVQATDSAHVSLTFPTIGATACVGGRAELMVSGAKVLSPNSYFARARDGVLTLAVGEATRLSSGQLSCLKLSAAALGDTAKYAVAYYDTQFLPKANYEYSKPGTVTARVADISDGTAATTTTASLSPSFGMAVPLGQGDATDHVRSDLQGRVQMNTQASGTIGCEEADIWRYATEPCVVGDTLHYAVSIEDTIQAKVLDVVANYFVVAAPLDSLAVLNPDLVDALASGAAALARYQLDPWTDLFGRRPETDNGQYMIMLNPTVDGPAGTAALTRMALRLSFVPDQPDLYQLMAHELAHSFGSARRQIRYESGGDAPNFEKWFSEGLAAFMSYKALAVRYDHALGTNDPENYWLPSEAYGRIEHGYYNTAGLMWHFAWRLSEEAGLTRLQAIDTVALGMWGNRWGCVDYPEFRCDLIEGLYEVLGRLMGPEFDPATAVLEYTLSQAADDRLESAYFQNPDYFRVWSNSYWPDLKIVAYSGTAVEENRLVGSTGYVRLHAPYGGAYELTSKGGDVEWMILRIE